MNIGQYFMLFWGSAVLLLQPTTVHAQTGISHRFTLGAIGAYASPKNGPIDNDFGLQINAAETHHLTKHIGFEFGLGYNLLQTKHSENQIDIRTHKRYALAQLRFHSVAVPINLHYYFNKSFNVFAGVHNAYVFNDVTEVYNVRYRYDEVMNESHKTLLSTTKGSYQKRLQNAYQVGFSYNLDLKRYYWQFGLGYARYAQKFTYTYNSEDYSFGISRFSMHVGFWFVD